MTNDNSRGYSKNNIFREIVRLTVVKTERYGADLIYI
jgi:hypothetical protein